MRTCALSETRKLQHMYMLYVLVFLLAHSHLRPQLMCLCLWSPCYVPLYMHWVSVQRFNCSLLVLFNTRDCLKTIPERPIFQANVYDDHFCSTDINWAAYLAGWFPFFHAEKWLLYSMKKTLCWWNISCWINTGWCKVQDTTCYNIKAKA